MTRRTSVARVDEARCIGCARCLEACPFDAIIGAEHFMHTVMVDFCPGCALCPPSCPVDCIEMVPTREDQPWSAEDARAARARARRRTDRRVRLQAELAPIGDRSGHRAEVQAALARARARRAGRKP